LHLIYTSRQAPFSQLFSLPTESATALSVFSSLATIAAINTNAAVILDCFLLFVLFAVFPFFVNAESERLEPSAAAVSLSR
jgi:hypothetical protein